MDAYEKNLWTNRVYAVGALALLIGGVLGVVLTLAVSNQGRPNDRPVSAAPSPSTTEERRMAIFDQCFNRLRGVTGTNLRPDDANRMADACRRVMIDARVAETPPSSD